MSFSQIVKNEVFSLDLDEESEKILLAGYILNNAKFIYTNAGLQMILNVNDHSISRQIFKYSRKLFDGNIDISFIQKQNLKKNKYVQLKYSGENLKNFLKKLHIVDLIDLSNNYNYFINNCNLDQQATFISGVFCSCGSVNSPKTTNYHLELQFISNKVALCIKTMLNNIGFTFKQISRYNKVVFYIKKSEVISDFLAKIKASQSLMEFATTLIDRDFTNSLNRVNNIGVYNQKRASENAIIQVDMINHIKQKNAFSDLPKKAQILANLRLQMPEASYSELAEELQNQGMEITKSGVSNLFRIMKNY